jgi:hypothetical protein
MKKSKIVTLILITSALASCNKPQQTSQKKVHMRSDTSASYSRVHHTSGWYYAFRPYGVYSNGYYSRTGFYSGGISESSNLGKSTTKSTAIRGGFGRSGMTVSS